jgi:GntR family transcriptional regulator, transcriptional repressor for pyruvate dehydrogenase complex
MQASGVKSAPTTPVSTKRSFRRGRLSEQVVAEMERAIHEEFPEPGTRLPKESELAERFGVSRIVIREAMKILEDRGVVEVRAGRGTLTKAPSADRVKESLMRLFRDQPLPTLAEMEQMMELRLVLEESVAGLAAVRATEEDLDAMAASLDAMGSGHSMEETIAADVQFHLAVAKAAHNPYFEMVIGPFTQVFIQQIKLTDSYTVGVESHREIFDKIATGDPVGARQAVRRLMQRTRQHMKAALQILGPEDAES